METAFWIIATIILCFVCAHQVNNVKFYKRAYKGALEDYQGMTKLALEVENKLRNELEKEQNDNKFLMRRIVDLQTDMALLRKTMN